MGFFNRTCREQSRQALAPIPNGHGVRGRNSRGDVLNVLHLWQSNGLGPQRQTERAGRLVTAESILTEAQCIADVRNSDVIDALLQRLSRPARQQDGMCCYCIAKRAYVGWKMFAHRIRRKMFWYDSWLPTQHSNFENMMANKYNDAIKLAKNYRAQMREQGKCVCRHEYLSPGEKSKKGRPPCQTKPQSRQTPKPML